MTSTELPYGIPLPQERRAIQRKGKRAWLYINFWKAIAYMVGFALLITEYLQACLVNAAQRCPFEPTGAEPQDLERGTPDQPTKATKKTTKIRDRPTKYTNNQAENGTPFSHETSSSRIPEHNPWSSSLSQPSRSAVQKQSKAKRMAQYFRRSIFKLELFSSPNENCTDSSSSFWHCRGQVNSPSARSSQEVGIAAVRQSVAENQPEGTQAGPSSTLTGPDSTPAVILPEACSLHSDRVPAIHTKEPSVVMKSWTTVDLPFKNSRQSFWDSEHCHLWSRIVGPFNCQSQQGNAHRRTNSHDSFLSLTRYVAAYDAFIYNGPRTHNLPNDQHKDNSPQNQYKDNSSDNSEILTREVYSEKSESPREQSEKRYVIKRVNRDTCAKWLDSTILPALPRPRALSVEPMTKKSPRFSKSLLR